MATMVSAATLVKDLEAALKRKDGYIMGARGQNPRTGSLDLLETTVKSSWKTTGYYYTQYSGKQRTQALKWREECERVWDCNGMAEGIYEIHTGININSKARYNYRDWCGVKGIGIIPPDRRVPGAAVFWSDGGASTIHHVAYLYKPVIDGHPEGDWYLIEARGVMDGVVMTKLLSRKPGFWGLMTKYYDYTTEGVLTVEPKLGDRLLRNGREGDDVREMQEGLIRLGYDLGRWGADGDFGDATEMAVRRFQIHSGLGVDGVFGPKTLAAFQAALVALETPVEVEPHYVVIEGGNCYIRMEPNTGAEIRGVAHEGSKLPYAGEMAVNGWLKVTYRDKPGWVSGKYGRVIVA